MIEFDQQGQRVQRDQYNAGGNITILSKEPWNPPVMLPPRAQSFVGREEDLAWLLQQLRSEGGVTLALCGPGGMGKTSLAAEVLSRLVAQKDWLVRFPGGIFYHSFYTEPSLATAFEDLALLCGEEPGANPRRAAIRALSRRRTILVFDGLEVLEDPLLLRDLGGQHVMFLLSRRQSDAPDLAHCRTLNLLPPNQAILLLQKLAGPRVADRQSVERLVEHIGGYPLALQLIGCYLSSRQGEVADYLQLFEREGLKAVHYGEHQAQSVPVLLQRTYNTLTSSEQQAFALLGLFAPAPFPLELMQGMLELPEQTVRQVLGSLINLSVLRRPEQGYEISHPLVHTFATEYILSKIYTTSSPSTNIITTWKERLLAALATHFDQSDPYDRSILALWQPHVFPLLSAEYLTTEQSLRAARLFDKVGAIAFTQGKYTDTEPLYQRSLTIREQQLGPTHPDTAISLNNLANLYRVQGKYAEAEPLYQRSLIICEQQQGLTHPNTASILNNLAELYRAQGKYAKAEPLCQRSLTIREQQLGPTHPDTATSLNNLAILYQDQGKYAKAEPLYQRSLTIREQQLGASHPSTATSLNNLANLYQDQGKYAKAEPLYQRSLTIREQQLGPTHPDTAVSLNNLANLYRVQGKYAEAEPLYQRSLVICEQHLGPTHPDTAYSLNNLAELYRVQGKYAEAEPLYQRSLIICEQQGLIHPNTANTLNNLAELYRAQGKYAKAEPLCQRSLTIREQQLGPTHPDTAVSLNNLANLYQDQGKYAKAEPLYQRSLQIREQQLGAGHPSTATSLNNLANLYQDQGKYAEAEPLFQRALVICEQHLGPTHPNTAYSLNNLAELYRVQGKYAEAEPLFRHSMAILNQVLGKAHHDTVSVQENYASLLQAMERDAKTVLRTQNSPSNSHQQAVIRKKAKQKMAKQSRKTNRHR